MINTVKKRDTDEKYISNIYSGSISYLRFGTGAEMGESVQRTQPEGGMGKLNGTAEYKVQDNIIVGISRMNTPKHLSGDKKRPTAILYWNSILKWMTGLIREFSSGATA